jgi:hypothetical protein
MPKIGTQHMTAAAESTEILKFIRAELPALHVIDVRLTQ